MSDILKFILDQPWYVLLLVFGSVGYFLYANYKSVLSFGSAEDVSYRYAKDTELNEEQQFAIALDAVMTAYWEVDNNILSFTHNNEKPNQFDQYMNGWFINTKEGYQELTQYFLHEGRRSYFDFIYRLYTDTPKNQWQAKMLERYGNNTRPYKMLERLSEHNVVDALIQKGVIKSESDLSIGVIGWDISTLVGQARRAYTAGLVSKEESLNTIKIARKLAVDHFNSWQAYGRSQVIGMALDYYRHDDKFFNEYIATYKSVLHDRKSPWNKMEWKG